MNGKTHVAGGIALGVGYTILIGTTDPMYLLAGSALGALIPDIDHPGGKLGHKFPILSRLVSLVFGHRGFTHSLIFLLLAFGLFSFVLEWPPSLETGLLLGMGSHVVLDAMTKRGVKIFFPFSMTLKLPPGNTTGGALDHALFFLFSGIAGWYGINFFIL